MEAGFLHGLLAEYGLRPLKGRSQNFLLDDRAVARMAEAANVSPGDRILEIGPGPGILTEALLDAGAALTAVEIDPGMCRLLRGRFGERKGFCLLEDDVLEIPNADLVRPSGKGEGGWKVVANLPYAITSPVIMKFLFGDPRPDSLTVMVQREVAERIVAKPKGMSALAVACQTLGEPRIVVRVPAGSFYPPPKVDSAVIHIALKTASERSAFFRNFSEEFYFRMVRNAFAQKRKQLGNSLKGLPEASGAPEKRLKQANILPSARPEELSVSDWSALAESFGQ